MPHPLRYAVLAAALLGATAAHAPAAIISVDSTLDGSRDDGRCGLREAVTAAFLNAPVFGCPAGSSGVADFIMVPAGTFALMGPRGDIADGSGDIDAIPTDIIISGAGPGKTIVDAAGNDRAFDVVAGATWVLEGMTITNGAPLAAGGAIRNAGDLTVRRVLFTGNTAGDGAPVGAGAAGDTGRGGGAIVTQGAGSRVTVEDSTFDTNRAGQGGAGGAAAGQGGTGGRGGSGGAIQVLGGVVTIERSTFTANLAGQGGPGGAGAVPGGRGQGGNGGAIAAFEGSAVAVNSTFVGNRAGDPGPGAPVAGSVGSDGGTGGAIAGALGSSGATAGFHSTFAGNLAGDGATGGTAVSGTFLNGSVITGPAPVCRISGANALPTVVPVGDSSCGTDAIVQGDARLGPLADNGGLTATLLPGAGSAALDVGPTCRVGGPGTFTDQRGILRPQGAGCDAGAVEVVPAPPGTPAPGGGSPGPSPAPGGGTPPTSGGTGTTPPTSGGAGGTGASVLSRLAVTTARGRIVAAFRLSAPARVRITVRHVLPGRRAAGRCVAPASAPRGAAICRRLGAAGSLVRFITGRTASVRLPGTVGGIVLTPGRYLLTARPEGGATVSRTFSLRAP